MNQTANVAYVKAKLEGLSEMRAVYPGRPDEMPALAVEYPLAYYEVGEVAEKWITFGTVEDTYDIAITVVLGPPDMTADIAQSEKTRWADRFRHAFAGDPSLGGNCYDANLKSGSNNLSTYRDTSDYPAFTYKLNVTEITQASALASE